MAPPPSSAAEVRSPCWRRAIHRTVGQCWRHISLGPAGGSFQRQAKPSADSRAKPDPKRGRQYTPSGRKVADCHRSPFSPPLPATVTDRPIHILPADYECLLIEWVFLSAAAHNSVL